MNQLQHQKVALSKAYNQTTRSIVGDESKDQLLYSVQRLKEAGEKAIDNQAPFSNGSFRFGDFMEAFEDSSIQELIWIPGSLKQGVLTEYLAAMGREQWKALFPAVAAREDFLEVYHSRFDEDRLEALTRANYLGFIAEVHVPIKKNLVISESGDLKAWSSGGGERIYPVYATSIMDLIDEVKKANKLSTEVDILKKERKEAQHG